MVFSRSTLITRLCSDGIPHMQECLGSQIILCLVENKKHKGGCLGMGVESGKN